MKQKSTVFGSIRNLFRGDRGVGAVTDTFGGFAAPKFQRVEETFRQNFDPSMECPEVGAAVCVIHDGEVVVNLWGGYKDDEGTDPWLHDTIVNTFSSTKGIGAACTTMLESAGQIEYGAPVAKYWPAFAANGKSPITVEMMLSHQAGLSGLREPLVVEDLFDWDKMVTLLEDAEPLWEPGTKAGYHAVTWGFLVGELVRRVTGLSIGTFLSQELSGALDARYFIGLPHRQEPHVAKMMPPRGEAAQSQAELSEILKLTLLNPYIEPGIANRRDFRAAELPALNGIGSAEGIARIFAPFALGGEFDGRRITSPEAIERATRIRYSGFDMNLGTDVNWCAGFFGNNDKDWYGPNKESFGHSGWGGSMGFADPIARISVGYAPNQMDANLNGDPRGLRLVGAIYDALAAH